MRGLFLQSNLDSLNSSSYISLDKRLWFTKKNRKSDKKNTYLTIFDNLTNSIKLANRLRYYLIPGICCTSVNRSLGEIKVNHSPIFVGGRHVINGRMVFWIGFLPNMFSFTSVISVCRVIVNLPAISNNPPWLESYEIIMWNQLLFYVLYSPHFLFPHHT